MSVSQPFAVYHEHPDWFRPLFAELDRRGIPYLSLDPRSHAYDPAETTVPFSLVFNRMSPSAYQRDGVQGLFFTQSYLAHLERVGVPVVNGLAAFNIELSKARQLTLLESLGLPYPDSRVINNPKQAMEAAAALRFPIIVKANIGGSGAGIVKFETRDDLAKAVSEGRLNLGVDHTALVQEAVPIRDQRITRVEILGGKFLYAIHVHLTGDTFNLCPADICRRSDGVELTRSACPVNAPKSGLKVEGFTPPAEVIEACETIMQTAGIDVGGIEYFIDDRDGSLRYYDINALSNFVADAENVVGFDPFRSLVDFLERKAKTTWTPKRLVPVSASMADWDAAI